MYYRHHINYQYPDRCDGHMITVKHLRDVTVDERYPYLQKSLWFKIQRGFLWVMLNGIVFPLMRLSHGLRIYGKENLKKHKGILKHGGLTISNHVFMWDYLCVLKVIRPHLAYFPAWKTNLEGSNAGLIRMAGAFPFRRTVFAPPSGSSVPWRRCWSRSNGCTSFLRGRCGTIIPIFVLSSRPCSNTRFGTISL